jgi:hypothetical protein
MCYSWETATVLRHANFISASSKLLGPKQCWFQIRSSSHDFFVPCGTAGVVQVNQVKGLYVEDSNIFGSGPNGVGLDGVAVQYGHVCRSDIHHADWCMYLKGEADSSNHGQSHRSPLAYLIQFRSYAHQAMSIVPIECQSLA